MNYVVLAVRLAASAFTAIIAVSLLPPFWTFTSLAAIVVTVTWACVSASRAKRRLRTRDDKGRLIAARARRAHERDAFGEPVR